MLPPFSAILLQQSLTFDTLTLILPSVLTPWVLLLSSCYFAVHTFPGDRIPTDTAKCR